MITSFQELRVPFGRIFVYFFLLFALFKRKKNSLIQDSTTSIWNYLSQFRAWHNVLTIFLCWRLPAAFYMSLVVVLLFGCGLIEKYPPTFTVVTSKFYCFFLILQNFDSYRYPILTDKKRCNVFLIDRHLLCNRGFFSRKKI